MNSDFRVANGGRQHKRLRATKKEPFRKSTYIKWFVVVVVILAVVSLGVSFVVFKVTDVQYEGSDYYGKEELNQLIFGSDAPNALLYKFFGDKDKEIPFVEKYDVDIEWPNKMIVTVYDKPIVGYINYMGCNMYFDREGMVVESSSKSYEGVPEVYGLKFDSIVLNTKLDVGDNDMFARILELTQGFDKYELDIDRIVFNSSYEVILDIDDIKVELGEPKDCTDRLYILKQMSAGLEGLKGTLKLSDYDGTQTSIIFTKEK
ncbi:MAG: hypothetical protein IJB96_04620 [Lachnospira sp.]|nr:hypothetical protein [Lachnospira sp.]